MSTHNICFRLEIRKILCGYPLLSVAMILLNFSKAFDKVNQLKGQIPVGPTGEIWGVARQEIMG